jgi:hypothetical protein
MSSVPLYSTPITVRSSLAPVPVKVTVQLFAGSEPGPQGEPGPPASLPPLVSAEAPGLAPALDNTAAHFLDGTGLWSKPVSPPGSFNGIIITSGAYGIDLAAVAPYAITAFLVQTTGGVCVASLTINGVQVGGANNVSVTTALVTVPLNAAVATGDRVGAEVRNSFTPCTTRCKREVALRLRLGQIAEDFRRPFRFFPSHFLNLRPEFLKVFVFP